MEANIYSKFRILLTRFFDEKYEISKYNSEMLLSCLEDPQDDLAKNLLGAPNFSDLIFHSINAIDTLSLQNQTLILNVVTILFRNELQYNKFQCQGFDLDNLKNHIAQHLSSRTSSYESLLAYIKLATVLISHGSGLKTVIAKRPLESILFSKTHQWPADISKAAYEYLSKLIWKLDEFEEEEALVEVLNITLKPLKDSPYQTTEIFNIEDECSFTEPVVCTLKAILTILEDVERISKEKCFIKLFKQCFLMKDPIHKIWAMARDQEVNYLIMIINFKFRTALARKSCVASHKEESDFLNEIIVLFINAISLFMKIKSLWNNNFGALLAFIVDVNLFWIKSGSKLCSSTFVRDGIEYEMEDQFVWFLILPMLSYVRSKKGATVEINEFNAKINHLHTEHIIKCGYNLKLILERLDLKKIAIQNLQQLFKLKGYLKTKQAGTLYQGLFCLLQTFMVKHVSCEYGSGSRNTIKTYDDVKMLSLTLAAIKMLLTEHNINRYENFEMICIQYGLMELIKQDNLPVKQLLQVLDLIELSIKQFLSPDLTLLVENRHGGALCDLAAVMPKLLHHEVWEIRDSALSLLLACTDIAFVKYVPLQKLIAENQLVVLASQAALSDHEYYVQTTGLKCLAAAAKIESMWRELLNHNPRIYKCLFRIVQHNPEGMVRTEAVRVLTQAYIHQKTSNMYENCMYQIMYSAALDDLHWEVQLESLMFWKQAIKKHFHNRGSIDGKFPKVTFSKEKRKIIKLDEKEVQRQLTGVMNDLSACGCLTVLNICLVEETNIEVKKKARCISNKLIQTLKYHKYYRVPENDVIAHDEATEPIEAALDLTVPSSRDNRDDVIEDIMNVKTDHLIMLLNKNEDTVNLPENYEERPRRIAKINPNKFLDDFNQTDYLMAIDNIMNFKLEPTNLDALLDEILEDYNSKICDMCVE